MCVQVTAELRRYLENQDRPVAVRSCSTNSTP